jgi:hypothetical protein
MSDNKVFYYAIENGEALNKDLNPNKVNTIYWYDLGMNNPYSFLHTEKKSVYYFCPLKLSIKDGPGQKLLKFLQNNLNNSDHFDNFYFDMYGNIKFDDTIVGNPFTTKQNFELNSRWDWMINKAGNSGMDKYKIDFTQTGAMISNIYLNYLLYYDDDDNIRLLYNPIHRDGFYEYIMSSDDLDTQIAILKNILYSYSQSVITITINIDNKMIFADPTCNCWALSGPNDKGWNGYNALPNALLNGENMVDYNKYMDNIGTSVIDAFKKGSKYMQYCIAPACFWNIDNAKNYDWGTTLNGNWSGCANEKIIATNNVPLCMSGVYYLTGEKNYTVGQACPVDDVKKICNKDELNKGTINISKNNSICKKANAPPPPSPTPSKPTPSKPTPSKPTPSPTPSKPTPSKPTPSPTPGGQYDCINGTCKPVSNGPYKTLDLCNEDCKKDANGKKKSNHTILIISIIIIIIIILIILYFLIKFLFRKN